MTSCEHSATAPCGLCELNAENDRLRERCEAYKGQVWAGSQEIERLRATIAKIRIEQGYAVEVLEPEYRRAYEQDARAEDGQ